MRILNRNKVRIYYANYLYNFPLTDENGRRTGEYQVLYSSPTEVSANVSAARGEVTTRQFGEDTSYDRIIVLDSPELPIKETSVFWIDTSPVIADDGTTSTPHDYIVKQVAVSLNSISIAVSKVNVTHG